MSDDDWKNIAAGTSGFQRRADVACAEALRFLKEAERNGTEPITFELVLIPGREWEPLMDELRLETWTSHMEGDIEE